MVFHCLSIPYAATSKQYSLCAFTQKVLKFCNEMTKRGHTVYHYGRKESEVVCTENVICISENPINESWRQKGFNQNIYQPCFQEFNSKVVSEIRKRKKSSQEFLMCWFGIGHELIAEELKNEMFVVEPSIGYDSQFAPIRIYETVAQLHRMSGLDGRFNGNYDPNTTAILPGFYEEDFKFKDKKEDYFLYLGRVVEAKGCLEIKEVCESLKKDVIFAGPVLTNKDVLKDSKYCKFLGFTDFEKSRELLSNAKALLSPTKYFEPCGWSVIEAHFSGTPTITTPFGGFSETNINGVTGFKIRNNKEMAWAISNIEEINPADCLEKARCLHSMDFWCRQYEQFLGSFCN